jgi:predicted nuclease with TOPRIM domain
VDDLLLRVIQVLGGGVVGYFFGKRQGQKQTQYQRRVEVVTELRGRLRELRDSFANMATPPEWRLPEEQFKVEEVEEVGEKLDALTGYFEDNATWLDEETQERLDKLTEEYASRWGNVRGRIDAEENPEWVLRAAWDWLDRVADEMEKINEGFDRLLGTHAPWWRRWFG